jgi:hypothetical protein
MEQLLPASWIAGAERASARLNGSLHVSGRLSRLWLLRCRDATHPIELCELKRIVVQP